MVAKVKVNNNAVKFNLAFEIENIELLLFFLTVCTPMGFIRLFGVVGQVLVKPNLMRDVNEEYQAFNLEEATVLRKIASNKNKTYRE